MPKGKLEKVTKRGAMALFKSSSQIENLVFMYFVFSYANRIKIAIVNFQKKKKCLSTTLVRNFPNS